MPIEIRELHIKVTVQDTNSSVGNAVNDSPGKKEELIEECVERVLELLNEKTIR